MIKQLLQDCDISFEPLNEYLNLLEGEDLLLISDNKEEFRTTKLIRIDGIKLTIHCLVDDEKKLISFDYHNPYYNHSVRQINFIMYNPEYVKESNQEYNNEIMIHYVDIDGRLANVLDSKYCYLDDDLKQGWQSKREVFYYDIKPIAQNNNLANLSINIENQNIQIISSSYEEVGPNYQLVLGGNDV